MKVQMKNWSSEWFEKLIEQVYLNLLIPQFCTMNRDSVQRKEEKEV